MMKYVQHFSYYKEMFRVYMYLLVVRDSNMAGFLFFTLPSPHSTAPCPRPCPCPALGWVFILLPNRHKR